jgi:hypothetical protein
VRLKKFIEQLEQLKLSASIAVITGRRAHGTLVRTAVGASAVKRSVNRSRLSEAARVASVAAGHSPRIVLPVAQRLLILLVLGATL